jgi:toxin FitB
MIVADSNVLSELMRVEPAPEVKRWYRFHRADELYTTAVTQAEMLYGAEVLPHGRRKTELMEALHRIFANAYAGRILPFDSNAAIQFADLTANRQRMGLPIKMPDAQIAAIVRSHGAALATRNVSDFEHCGIELINPWTATG